mmetsp:Transcript_24138/g.50184  ORF Transcript_24138/g.50184 Transcript_24138/m.50184 type:complete len:84 (+) Transcript_24138:444-695(+)
MTVRLGIMAGEYGASGRRVEVFLLKLLTQMGYNGQDTIPNSDLSLSAFHVTSRTSTTSRTTGAPNRDEQEEEQLLHMGQQQQP